MNSYKSKIILMVQSPYTVFCYFNVSPRVIKQFQDVYGEEYWKNSKLVLKVYNIQEGISKEIKTIFIDELSNNWYINLDKDDLDIFIKIGRIFIDGKFNTFAISNTVTTPRAYESFDNSLYFVDVSQSSSFNRDSFLPKFKKNIDFRFIHREPKKYFFTNNRKSVYYSDSMVYSNHYYNKFFHK